jgi:glycosyltransferase involved in cell wall biosynthesis
MSRVQVLLSTYNGERFLAPLLDSVLDQTHRDLEVRVRDDGSRDATWKILERYTARAPVRAERGENLGVVRSFFALLQSSDPDAAFLALADQDDVWMEDKLARAVAALGVHDPGTPALYCARLTLVDEELHPLGLSPMPVRGPSFSNALVQNIATGCTIVINQAARQVLLRGMPQVAWMHDWWMYLVVAAFGVVIYDPEPRTLYRQHGANAVGSARDPLRRTAVKVARFARRGFALQSRVAQAEEFRRIHGAWLDERKRAQLDRFLAGRRTLAERLRFIRGDDVVYQSRLDDALFKGLILLNQV